MRKHTPIVSEQQRRFVYAVERAQKTGKGSAKVKEAAKSWPSKGHSSPRAHLEEVEDKKLVKKVQKKLDKAFKRK